MRYDYQARPVKPTLDVEAWYENNKCHCGKTPFAIRHRAYFTILAGAFGHTYGAGGIGDGLKDSKKCSGNWETALSYEGYKKIGYLSKFLHGLRHNFLKLTPEHSIIINGNSDSYETHIQASVANDNSFALVYSASDGGYVVDLTKLSTHLISAKWYNPHVHEYQIDKNDPYYNINSSQAFDPPGNSGAGNDWVLILGNISLQ